MYRLRSHQRTTPQNCFLANVFSTRERPNNLHSFEVEVLSRRGFMLYAIYVTRVCSVGYTGTQGIVWWARRFYRSVGYGYRGRAESYRSVQ